MQVIRDTRLEFAYLVTQARPPRPSMTAVVKATFALVPGGVCTLAAAQQPCTGDVHHEDDDALSVRYDSDFAVFKPHGECFVAGSCHAPGGRETAVSGVAFKIGAVSKALAVFGDRHWVARGPFRALSKPAPFESMPLRWERSFGGAGHDENPAGVGLVEVPGPGGTPRRAAPNIERPDALVTSPDDRPTPAGCFPVPRTAKSRLARAGTYDAAWKRERWPWLPSDFDWSYFNAAPADQQIRGYWRGDEEIALRNLDPVRPLVRTRLPGLRARCFLETRGALREVPLNLDTITVDADAGLVLCVWRGMAEVASEKLEEIDRVFVADEPITARRPVSEFRGRLAARLDALRAEGEGFAPEEPALAAPAPPLPAGADVGAAVHAALGAAGLAAAGLASLDEARRAVDAARRDEVRARLAAGAGLAGEDLSGADLTGMDFAGADLSGAIFARAVLRGANFAGANLDGAVLAGADASAASLKGASLRGADLTGCVAERADFEGAALEGALLNDARAPGAKLPGAALVGAELVRADLSRADLRRARLDRADLSRAVLDGADLTAASLVEVALEGASALRAVMDDCDLTGLRASGGVKLTRGSFRRAKAAGSHWSRAELDEANFAGAELTRADFEGASLRFATLSGCSMRAAVFREARLVRAHMVKCDAMEATFEAADLSGADLRGANLYTAEFWRAKTDGANLELANVAGTKLG